MEKGEEGEGLGREDLALVVLDLSRDVNALEDGFGGGHFGGVCLVVGLCSKCRLCVRRGW